MKNKFVLTLVWLLTTAAALGQNLIPLPNRADKRDGGFLLTRHTEIVSPDFPELADYLNDHLERLTGYRLPVTEHLRGVRQIVISRKSELPPRATRSTSRFRKSGSRAATMPAPSTRFKRFSSCCPPQCTTRPPLGRPRRSRFRAI